MSIKAKSRLTVLEAIRHIFEDESIEFGSRWEFERDGISYIVRANLVEDGNLDFQSSLPGYDRTVNIQFYNDRPFGCNIVDNP